MQAYKRYLLSEGLGATELCVGLNAIAIALHRKGETGSALVHHVEQVRVAQDRSAPPHYRVVGLCNAGMMQRELGQMREALGSFRRARDIAQSAGDTAGELLALGHIALTLTLSEVPGTTPAAAASAAGGAEGGARAGRLLLAGEKDAASEVRESIERVVRLQKTYDDPRNRYVAQHVLGVVASAEGRWSQAAEHFAHARELSAAVGDAHRSRLAKCSFAIAQALERVQRGDLAFQADRAVDAAERSARDAIVERSLAAMTATPAALVPRPVVLASLAPPPAPVAADAAAARK